MGPNDVESCVRAHVPCFPQSFLSFLGPTFLKTYYDGLVHSGLAVAFVCEDAGKVIAFVTGFEQPREFYAYLLKTRLLQFSLGSIKAVLKKPAILPKLIGALVSPGKNPSGPGYIILSSIAVLPAYRRRGMASCLCQRFVAEAAVRSGK